MASETANKRPSAAENLVKATITVLDNLEIQAHMDRASFETAKALGAHSITLRG